VDHVLLISNLRFKINTVLPEIVTNFLKCMHMLIHSFTLIRYIVANYKA